MRHWLTYSFCLITFVINAQVIKFQSVGGAGTVPSQATNGTIKHSMSLGNTVSQGIALPNAYNQAGFFFGNIDYRPAQQASSIVFSGLEPDKLTLTWSNGNGTRRVVVGHAVNDVTATLASGTFYGSGANASFGTGTEIGASSGNFVVYDGTENTVSVSNLSPSTVYHFKVFEYNGKYLTNNANIEYQPGDGSGNPASRTTLALQPSTGATGLVFTNVTKNQTTLSWTNGDGGRRLVLTKEGNAVDGVPQDGSSYTASPLFNSAPELSPSGNRIVFDDVASTVTVTGLSPNTVYHYKVIDYKGSGLDNNYLITAASVASQLTLTVEPVAIDETGISQTSFAANWQAVAGAGDYYLDVSDNSNFTSFVANFNNKKITGGVFTSSVTGLTAGTTYYYRVRAENAAGQSANSNAIEVLTVPATPTVLASSAITTNSFTANWTASVSATEYFVDVATDPDFTQGVPGFTEKSVLTNSVLVTGLAPGTNYYIRVRAKNSSDTSPNASSGYNQITITEAPVALDASNEQKSSFKLKWTTVKGAAEYEVNVLNDVTSAVVSGYPKLLTHPQSEEIVTGLSAATKYKYFVRGKNNGGYSANSNVKIVITLDDGGQVFNKPSVTINAAQSSITNVSTQVSNGEPPLMVSFKHRPITDSKFTTEAPVTLPATNVSRNQALEPAWADELGIEYYFVISDNANRKDSTASFYAYKSFAAQNIPGFTGFDGSDEGYRMFSIPADLKGDNEIQTVFQPLRTQFEGYNKEKWRLFHYPGGVDQEYLEYEKDLDKIEQGMGYWFNAKENPSALSITAGVIPSNQQTAFKVTLKPGWNQIGNPYPFNILWSTVQAANPGAELKKLWLFNRQYDPKEVLPAWQGAFVFSAKGGEVKFPVSAKTSRSVRTASPDFPNKPDDGIWFLPIAMTFHELHHVGAIGMHPDASDDMDKFDEPTLPRFVSFLEMKTRHENSLARNFSEDVVKSSHHYTWSFTVSSNLTDGEGELNWENLTMNWQNVSSSLMLLDVSQQVLLDMRTAQRYRFPFENGKQFKIIFSKEGIYKAGTTRLGEAYPNPFANHISVPVLAEEENEIMRLEFFDLLGRRLISLQQQFPVPGQYVFEWDGRTSLGEPVPEGLILYHIRKEDGSKTGVKRLVKIN